MNEIINQLRELAKEYRTENEKIGNEFIFTGNEEELKKWIKSKDTLSIKEEHCYEIIEKLGE